MDTRRRCHARGTRRSGCTACKSRHKKCDEGKPRCRNCVRRNLQCDQPDVFRTAILTATKTTSAKPPTLAASQNELASNVHDSGDVLQPSTGRHGSIPSPTTPETHFEEGDDGHMLEETRFVVDSAFSPATSDSSSSRSSVEGGPLALYNTQPSARHLEHGAIFAPSLYLSNVVVAYQC